MNVPGSTSRSMRSRAVSLSAACCLAIFSSPPPSLALARRSWRSSTSGRRIEGGASVLTVRGLSSSGAAACASDVAELGGREAGDLGADDTRPRGHVRQQVAQLRRVEAAGRRIELAGHHAPDRGCRRRGGRTPRGPRAPHAGSSVRTTPWRAMSTFSAVVEVAPADEHHALGPRPGAVAGVPQADGARQAHAARGSRSGVVSGVLKSPWASSHSSHASGQRRATAGTVATQIEQSVAVSSGRRVSATVAAAASSVARASRRSSS